MMIENARDFLYTSASPMSARDILAHYSHIATTAYAGERVWPRAPASDAWSTLSQRAQSLSVRLHRLHFIASLSIALLFASVILCACAIALAAGRASCAVGAIRANSTWCASVSARMWWVKIGNESASNTRDSFCGAPADLYYINTRGILAHTRAEWIRRSICRADSELFDSRACKLALRAQLVEIGLMASVVFVAVGAIGLADGMWTRKRIPSGVAREVRIAASVCLAIGAGCMISAHILWMCAIGDARGEREMVSFGALWIVGVTALACDVLATVPAIVASAILWKPPTVLV